MYLQRHSHPPDESAHGIDLAPMLDFVLNLLIFFIITAIFVKEAGLMVNRPAAVEDSSGETDSLQIQVLESGEVLVDNRLVDVRAVRANIERVHALNADSGVLILAAEGAPTGTVVTVIDQVRLGGIADITFATSD